MPTRMTLIFALTTDPDDRGSASPHSAGWTESFWREGTTTTDDQRIRDLAQARARLLPLEASIIGFRLGFYTLSGNKILPSGTSTGKFQYAGVSGAHTDLPQVALEMSGKTSGGANSSRFTMRGMPDEIMVNGEYQPGTGFKGSVTRFITKLTGDAWQFLGRDIAQPAGRVLSIAAGIMTLDADIGVAAGDYVRLLRVFDEDEKSIQGAYRVTAVAGGTTLTLAGFDPAVVVANSGLARKDLVKLFPFTTVQPSRAVVRKVGRPFESYRGRRSKR